MSIIKKIRQEKEEERKRINRKIDAGQTLKEHIAEVSVFEIDALKRSRMILNINGEEVELRPESYKPAE